MEVTQFTWRLIVLFTPGILTASMVSRFTVHKEWSNFDFIVRSMLFGLSCYFLLYLLSKICLFNGILDSGLGRFFVNVNETPSAKIIAFAGICSIPIAFVYSFVVKRKWVYRFAKFLGITSKTGGIDEWNDFLNFDNIQWVMIRFVNRPTVYNGSVSSFSEAGSVRELVLADVMVYPEGLNGNYYELDNVYLTGNLTDIIIEVAKEA